MYIKMYYKSYIKNIILKFNNIKKYNYKSQKTYNKLLRKVKVCVLFISFNMRLYDFYFKISCIYIL